MNQSLVFTCSILLSDAEAVLMATALLPSPSFTSRVHCSPLQCPSSLIIDSTAFSNFQDGNLQHDSSLALIGWLHLEAILQRKALKLASSLQVYGRRKGNRVSQAYWEERGLALMHWYWQLRGSVRGSYPLRIHNLANGPASPTQSTRCTHHKAAER